MLQIIGEAAEVQGTAVILSSHLLEVVEMICDRVLILNHGRTVGTGSVAEIKQKVALPHDCRIQIPADAIPVAISELSTMPGVTANLHANHTNELIVTIQGARANSETNIVLERLIQKGIPIEGFSQDTARLSDAFLSMIEEKA